MYYTVYQTTNLLNGRFYVGIHVTEDPYDSYLGSGDLLKTAVRKYGRASFKKEVLFIFDNPEAMSEKEAELVTREFVDRDDTYNLVPGGHQGDAWYQAWKRIPKETRVEAQRKSRETYREHLRTSPEFLAKAREWGSQLAARMRAEGRVPRDTFKGRKHSEESLQKIRDSKKGKGKGSENPSFGTVWVCVPGEKEKKVPSSEVLVYLSDGWVRGRKSSSWGRVLDSLKDQ